MSWDKPRLCACPSRLNTNVVCHSHYRNTMHHVISDRNSKSEHEACILVQENKEIKSSTRYLCFPCQPSNLSLSENAREIERDGNLTPTLTLHCRFVFLKTGPPVTQRYQAPLPETRLQAFIEIFNGSHSWFRLACYAHISTQ